MISFDDNERKYPVLTDIREFIASVEKFSGDNFVNLQPGIFFLTDVREQVTRNGSRFFKARTRDRNFSDDLRIWEWPEGDNPSPGTIVYANYGYSDEFGLSLSKIIKSISIKDFIEKYPKKVSIFIPSSDVKKYHENLKKLIDKVVNPFLRKLLEDLLLDEKSETSVLYMKVPAASSNHHVRIGGLLEHSVNIANISLSISNLYPAGMFNDDLVIAGALLHDIGKIYTYNIENFSFDYTDDGMLEDHIAIGIKIVSRQIARIKDFPGDVESRLLHIIISHHGLKEWGSPVIPKTMEAVLIHNVDRLEAQVDSFISTKSSYSGDESWSDWNRMLGTRIFLKDL